MSLGAPPSVHVAAVSRLFAPLFVPCLAFLASVAFVYYKERWGTPTTEPEDATQPLIREEMEGDRYHQQEPLSGDGYPGFFVPEVVEADDVSGVEEVVTQPPAPTSSYGAI